MMAESEPEASPELDGRIAEIMEPIPSRPPSGVIGCPVSAGGWWLWNGMGWMPNKHPSTDPAADYEVLKVAREWPEERREAFCEALLDIWGERREAAGWPSLGGILYQPGDYSRAALAAAEKTDGD